VTGQPDANGDIAFDEEPCAPPAASGEGDMATISFARLMRSEME
jgi:hypothetical protein